MPAGFIVLGRRQRQPARILRPLREFRSLPPISSISRPVDQQVRPTHSLITPWAIVTIVAHKGDGQLIADVLAHPQSFIKNLALHYAEDYFNQGVLDFALNALSNEQIRNIEVNTGHTINMERPRPLTPDRQPPEQAGPASQDRENTGQSPSQNTRAKYQGKIPGQNTGTKSLTSNPGNPLNSDSGIQPGLEYTDPVHTKSEPEEPTMTTGWKTSSESRRPHSKAKLKRRPPSLNPSKKGRTSSRRFQPLPTSERTALIHQTALKGSASQGGSLKSSDTRENGPQALKRVSPLRRSPSRTRIPRFTGKLGSLSYTYSPPSLTARPRITLGYQAPALRSAIKMDWPYRIPSPENGPKSHIRLPT